MIVWKVLRVIGYLVWLMGMVLLMSSVHHEIQNSRFIYNTSLIFDISYIFGLSAVPIVFFFVPAYFLIRYSNKKIKLINSNKITDKQAREIEKKGVSLLETILNELRDEKKGMKSTIRTFNGNYLHYKRFFQSLEHFHDNKDDSCMFIIYEKDVSIGVSLIKLHQKDLLCIEAEKLT